MRALVHLAAGIGNVVLATPLVRALTALRYEIDLLLNADYAGVGELFADWAGVRLARSIGDAGRCDVAVPAVPPFYWPRFRPLYAGLSNALQRPPDALFYQDEQGYYLAFARKLGYPAELRPEPWLPVGPADDDRVGAQTVVLAPGCKTGEMAAKRWPWFSELAARLPDVAVVGTRDDLQNGRSAIAFPPHVTSFVDALSLRETAELLCAAGVVVSNDSGLGHLAAATGTPTVLLFGPTPHLALGRLAPHAHVLRGGLACEPCWFNDRFAACARRIDCLHAISVGSVERLVRSLIGCE